MSLAIVHGYTKRKICFTYFVYSSLFWMKNFRITLTSWILLSTSQHMKSTFFSSFFSWNFNFRTMILTSSVYGNYANMTFLFVTDDERHWLFTPRRSIRKYKFYVPRTSQNSPKLIANIDQVQHVAWDHTIIRDWQLKRDVMCED